MTGPDVTDLPPAAKGWCPGAWRPMLSGDGLIVRVRPHLGRLSRAQVLALCELAQRHGSGVIEVTRRANLQLRGVREGGLGAITQMLAAQGLLDPDPATEARRNILVAPGWVVGDDTLFVALDLAGRMADLPPLPAKFGFVVDAGPAPVLGDAPGDIRVERGRSGGLILRADGRATGVAVLPGDAAPMALRLAVWFAATALPQVRRMAALRAPLPDWATGTEPPGVADGPVAFGPGAQGFCAGLPFGQIDAAGLAALIAPAKGLRLTPWRRVMFEDVTALPCGSDLMTAPGDARLRVDACPGAPFCASATVPTRAVGARLAALVPPGRSLHVSGCAKGCARSAAADITLTGRAGRFDLIGGGSAAGVPDLTGLVPDELADRLAAWWSPMPRGAA